MDARIYWENMVELMALIGLNEKELAEVLAIFSPVEHLENGKHLMLCRHFADKLFVSLEHQEACPDTESGFVEKAEALNRIW